MIKMSFTSAVLKNLRHASTTAAIYLSGFPTGDSCNDRRVYSITNHRKGEPVMVGRTHTKRIVKIILHNIVIAILLYFYTFSPSNCTILLNMEVLPAMLSKTSSDKKQRFLEYVFIVDHNLKQALLAF